MNILLISNMYPSTKYPYYGVFVKNTIESLELKGYKVKKCYMTKQNNKILKFIKYIWFFIKIIKYVLIGKYDYIYVHYPAFSCIPLYFTFKIKKLDNIVVNLHGNDWIPESKKDEFLLKFSYKAVLHAKKVIVPSDYFKDSVLSNKLFENKDVVVFPSGGIDSDTFFEMDKSEARKKLNFSSEKKYIGYSSRIETNKGWDTFIEASTLLIKKNRDYKIVIAGDGSEYNLFLQHVKNSKIEENIIYFPLLSQQQLNVLFNALDILVFPTRRKSESLGLIGLEAMASGCLLVAGKYYGPSSYMKDGINGFTFDPYDKNDLYNVLTNVLNLMDTQKSYIIDIKENGKITSRKYSKEKTEELLVEIFD